MAARWPSPTIRQRHLRVRTAKDGYAPLERPFAMPGFEEQEFNGALFVGEGGTRFSTSVSLPLPR